MPRRKNSAQPPAPAQPLKTTQPPAPAQPSSDPIDIRGQHRMDIERPASDEPGSIQSIPSAEGMAPGETAFVEPQGKTRGRMR